MVAKARTIAFGILASSFLLSTSLMSYGQQKADAFMEYTDLQMAKANEAYDKKDFAGYRDRMKEFTAAYENLPTEDKKKHASSLYGAYYNLAGAYSLLNDKPKALASLQRSIDAGFNDYNHMQRDSDLDNIRNEKGFKDLNERLRRTGDFLFILKNSGSYDPSDNRHLPPFTYQPADNPDLTALRKAFNLDSIAGEGTDVLRIMNLLRWVHNLVPHDGMNGNPVVKNAMSMIDECKREKRGLNCRGLALILNECYLSMGMRSRIVTCLPKDSLKVDQDCHVINSVYSETLGKWLWMDPTFNAYVMDDKGTLLSIEEVRERIVNDRPLILNPDANWNNRTPQTKEEYLYSYMAKNLYILECPVNSVFDMETAKKGREYGYIRLVPSAHHEQKPDSWEERSNESNTTWKYHRTNNPKLFWQSPK